MLTSRPLTLLAPARDGAAPQPDEACRGSPWRDLPAESGPWQTVWARHRGWSEDGTWDRIHTTVMAQADAAGLVDWSVSVDSTINRAHQHGTNLPRGGTRELPESARRA